MGKASGGIREPNQSLKGMGVESKNGYSWWEERGYLVWIYAEAERECGRQLLRCVYRCFSPAFGDTRIYRDTQTQKQAGSLCELADERMGDKLNLVVGGA